jgi:hypothetical protein
MKQTAVDFIVTKFNHLTWLRRRGEISEVTEYERQAKFFFEAKEMEKEQMIDFTMDFMGEDNSYESYRRESALDLFNKTFNTNG